MRSGSASKLMALLGPPMLEVRHVGGVTAAQQGDRPVKLFLGKLLLDRCIPAAQGFLRKHMQQPQRVFRIPLQYAAPTRVRSCFDMMTVKVESEFMQRQGNQTASISPPLERF
jgi:hypothetical protein